MRLACFGYDPQAIDPAATSRRTCAAAKDAGAGSIRIANYPLVKDLCWTGAVTELPARHAFAIYERNWRFVDRNQLKPRERVLLDGLIRKFCGGVINAQITDMARKKQTQRPYRRACHRLVGQVLSSLNGKFLDGCSCYFGGGTQIALALDDFRESRDIDFICANRTGFRRLRETVSDVSLGSILSEPLPLAREVRADRDGIRTFFAVGSEKLSLRYCWRRASISLAPSIKP